MKTVLPVALIALFAIDVQAQIPAFYPEVLYVQASSLNLREKPDVKSKSLESLPKGAQLSYLEQVPDPDFFGADSVYGHWIKVKSPKNKIGYVADLYVHGEYLITVEGDYYQPVPPVNWYGVYKRDSFADVMYAVTPRKAEVYNEMFGDTIPVLLTGKPERSKFLLGCVHPLTTGYAGPIGMYDPGMQYIENNLYPGVQLAIHPGNDQGDTLIKPTVLLAGLGCAVMAEDYIQMPEYRLLAYEYGPDGVIRQYLDEWIKVSEGMSPYVSLVWYGDIDHDNLPDMVLEDCPEEVSCRYSLYLSSKARPGEFLKKVAEYYLPME